MLLRSGKIVNATSQRSGAMKPVYVLVFDVETTGLFSEKTPIEQYPYITQITMIKYDIINKKIASIYNQYIKIPENIEIPEIVTKITGITRQICDEKGVSIIDALNKFYCEYSNVQTVIAHNISFDTKILKGEFYRNRGNPELRSKKWEDFYIFRDSGSGGAAAVRNIYCTMKESQYLCKIHIKNNYIKYPKLIETFRYLFPNEPEPQNLHNSLIDTLICLRCFIMMKWREDIAKDNNSGYGYNIDISTERSVVTIS